MNKIKKRILTRLEALGHWIFYTTLRYLGRRAASLLLWPVVGCYVVFSRKIHRNIRPYLDRRFPEATKKERWLHTFRLVKSFGEVLVERGWLGLDENAELECQFIGRARLFQLLEQKKGLILLTAHVGNWQSALAHLTSMPVRVHALMRYDKDAVAKHFFDLQGERQRTFEIIDAEGAFGGMVEAAAALQRGEIVTIMGDRYVGGSASETKFMGETVRIPDSAYQLAATSGAPVVILLAARTGLKQFELQVWDDFIPENKGREHRAEMLARCARRFAMGLEEYVDEHPYQWYNFYNFWKQ